MRYWDNIKKPQKFYRTGEKQFIHLTLTLLGHLPPVQSRACLHICVGWQGSTLLAGQIPILILISLKLIMYSSKNGFWTSPIMKSSKFRVKQCKQNVFPTCICVVAFNIYQWTIKIKSPLPSADKLFLCSQNKQQNKCLRDHDCVFKGTIPDIVPDIFTWVHIINTLSVYSYNTYNDYKFVIFYKSFKTRVDTAAYRSNLCQRLHYKTLQRFKNISW